MMDGRFYDWQASQNSLNTGSSHACNCIGCCKTCGMCRTSPKHTVDNCKAIAALNVERERILNG